MCLSGVCVKEEGDNFSKLFDDVIVLCIETMHVLLNSLCFS